MLAAVSMGLVSVAVVLLLTETSSGQSFRSDAEILAYLNAVDRECMIWSCRNAINRVDPGGNLDLNCSIIGVVWSYTWQFKGREIASYVGETTTVIDENRYEVSVTPHELDRIRYYSYWRDVRFTIKRASHPGDSGVYNFTISHFRGDCQEMNIYVDLAGATR